MRFSVGILIALVLVASEGSLARAASKTADVLVAFAPDATVSEREAAVRAIGGVVDDEIKAIGVTRIVFAGDPRAAAAALTHQRGVAAAEADGVVRLDFVPNDPLYLSDPYSGLGEWGLRIVKVDRAWDLTRGSPDVIVATVDTGVDANHPDLVGALLAPAQTLRNAGGSGCAISPVDDNSHGTHVAGIIAATANNGSGIAGVASGVKLLSIKALDCTGAGSLWDVASGITYAADHGARVVNVSIGTPDDSFTLQSAVEYAQNKGVLVVAAAGNCGTASSKCALLNEPSYPAAYPGVLAVGATASDDRRAFFSTEAGFLSVVAPGERIVSTTPTYATWQSARGMTLNYGLMSGTSQAAPFVTGLAALILSADPKLTSVQVMNRIKATADDLGLPGFDTSYGAGRVNALRALSAPGGTYGAVYDTSRVPPTVSAGGSLTATVKITNTSNFTWTANSAVRLAYHWNDSAGAATVWDGVRTPIPADIPINGSIDLPATVAAPKAPGRYTLRFDMVREGVTWFSGTGVRTGDVPMAVASAAAVGLGATYAPAVRTSSLVVGTQTSLAVTVTNTGTAPWSSTGPQPVRLSYHWVAPGGAMVVWDGARVDLPSNVAPGASATVQLPLVTPASPGVFLLRLDLVQEGVTWFSAQGVATTDLAFDVRAG